MYKEIMFINIIMEFINIIMMMVVVVVMIYINFILFTCICTFFHRHLMDFGRNFCKNLTLMKLKGRSGRKSTR